MEIPDKHPLYDQKDDLRAQFSIFSSRMKEEWHQKGMYAFVCWQWVTPLAQWIGKRTVLEVMSGAGWLAKALRERGVSIIATDDDSWAGIKKWEKVSEIEVLDATEAVKTYGRGAEIMIISWPYMDDDGHQAIKALYEINPEALIIYIGEWAGCTANEDFLNHFDVVEDKEFNLISKEYFSWPGLHDSLYLGRYNPNT